jgi:deoxyribodipyrimidine photo-lyase
MNVLWWIRRDLRLSDNPALQAALAELQQPGDCLLPVFILDPKLAYAVNTAAARLDFLFAGLRALNADLRERHSHLLIRQGDPLEELACLFAESESTLIVAEADVSPFARRRDAAVAARLPLRLVGSPLVFPPGSVVKADGSPYTVFTPFAKAWKALPFPGAPLPPPGAFGQQPAAASLEIPAPQTSSLLFPPGEAHALARLRAFTAGPNALIYRYQATRNTLHPTDTSLLSPYLRFGMISARQSAHAARQAIETAPDTLARQSAETWLNELIWREFFANILYHFPHVLRHSFRPGLRRIAWQNDPAHFAAWCHGQTGYPVVDAAMRQLLASGWMHNRARMITASFLVKDLLVDWRWGERWFMQHLLDGDPAANNGGWQWTAGTGTDAAPYFRIFNPVSQGEKFDPQGAYVRHWLPELANVPGEYIHQPWLMPLELQKSSGCLLGIHYPLPIVNHAHARQRALAAYAAAR